MKVNAESEKQKNTEHLFERGGSKKKKKLLYKYFIFSTNSQAWERDLGTSLANKEW